MAREPGKQDSCIVALIVLVGITIALTGGGYVISGWL